VAAYPLRPGRERRGKEADDEHDRESRHSHEHLVRMAGGSLADECYSDELAA
jgi:hypothetical protein